MSARTRVPKPSLKNRWFHAVPQRDFAAPPLSLVRATVCSSSLSSVAEQCGTARFSQADGPLVRHRTLASAVWVTDSTGGSWVKNASTLANNPRATLSELQARGMAWTMLTSGTAYLRRVLMWLHMVWCYPLLHAPLFSLMVPIFFFHFSFLPVFFCSLPSSVSSPSLHTLRTIVLAVLMVMNRCGNTCEDGSEGTLQSLVTACSCASSFTLENSILV